MRDPSLRVVVRRDLRTNHPSVYPVQDLTAELQRVGYRVSDRGSLGRGVARAAIKAGLASHVVQRTRSLQLVPMMGLVPADLFPSAWFQRSVVVCWDVWEPNFPEWERFFARSGISHAFITSRQATEHFERVLTGTTVSWLPEATDPRHYSRGSDLADRPVGVIEMGRRHEKLHIEIADALARAGIRHQSDRKLAGETYGSRATVSTALARAAVSVCLPSSITHPQRSGSIEVFTHRYLESMASRCLIWGHAPSDLVSIFGYCPVVEIDWSDPTGQLIDIVENISEYQPLVNRNADRVQQTSTWEHRVADIGTYLARGDGASDQNRKLGART